jgi:ComF family protein
MRSCFCAGCRTRLIPQDMYKTAENEFTNRFWGRILMQGGAALFKFSRQNPIQRALHRLKYGNCPEIGSQLGYEMGQRLRSSPLFNKVQGVVCVPLHPLKERRRGYNQSAVFGRAVAEVLGVPFLDGALRRTLHSTSQTRKKRMERFENVEKIFEVAKPALLRGRHILLVDDVLTTGATLEACAEAMLQLPGVTLSMATIAMAGK